MAMGLMLPICTASLRCISYNQKPDWFFPQGVLRFPLAYDGGRAWFSLTQRDFENLTNQEIYDGGIAPKDEKLAQKVSRFLNQMGKKLRKCDYWWV